MNTLHGLRGRRLTACLVLALAVAGCSRRAEPPAPRPVAVRVASVRWGDAAETIGYLGTVRAAREIVVTARIQGTVVRMPREEGARVRRGDVLVDLEAPQLEAAVTRHAADVTYWTERLEVDRRLDAAGALPAEQVRASRHALAVARAALSEAEVRRSWTEERAPCDGTVLDRPADPGQHVLPGQPLLVLAEAAAQIEVDVLEEDLRRGIAPGVEAVVVLPGDERRALRVATVGATPVGATRSYTVTIPLSAPAGTGARHGSSVPIRFVTRRSRDASLVPRGALAGVEGAHHIYLVRDGKAHRWSVEPGPAQDGWIAVAPSPAEGDTVAVSNVDALQDGAPVFAVPAGEVGP